MKNPGFASALLASLALAACSTSGTKIDQSQTQSFVVGQTTVADVENKLGQPQSQSHTSDGLTTLIYSYSHFQSHPENFIPFAGAFVGGHDAEHQSEILVFGANGKLLSMTQSSGQNNTNPG